MRRIRVQRLARFLLWSGLGLFVLGTFATAWSGSTGWYSYSAMAEAIMVTGGWPTFGVFAKMAGLVLVFAGCLCKAISSRGSEAEERGDRRDGGTGSLRK